MNKWITLLIISAFGWGMLSSCGSNENKQKQAEQARQDSLKKVRQQRIAKQRRDSVSRAKADSMEEATSTGQSNAGQEPQMDVSFDPDGVYTLQVEAWRSKNKAQSQVDKWVNRGFENAFVVQYGNKESGDIWYRVRLGRLSSQQSAERLQKRLKDTYNATTWISTAK